MKKLILLNLFIFSLIFVVGCSKEETVPEKFSLEGMWKVDSIAYKGYEGTVITGSPSIIACGIPGDGWMSFESGGTGECDMGSYFTWELNDNKINIIYSEPSYFEIIEIDGTLMQSENSKIRIVYTNIEDMGDWGTYIFEYTLYMTKVES